MVIFNNLIEEFLTDIQIKKRLSKNTIITYKNTLKQFGKWFRTIDNKEFIPQNITSDHISAFKQHLIKLNRANKTINKMLVIISIYLNWAVDKKLIKYNPAINIKGIKQEKELPRWLNHQELTALLNTLVRESNTRNKLIIMLILFAGLQVRELVELKKSDVQVTENKMYLNLSGRRIPVYKTLEWTLRKYLDGVDKKTIYLLSSSRSDQLSVRAIQHVITEYGDKARIDNLTAITLRHTFGYKLGLTGTDPYSIAALMGYATTDNLPNI
ncbi:MAG: tyrosine-type recombinase/integrase, partial [Dysgonamonadaceae bacterium]|nr:tyrosine-type recombinase/integrase [Dysgonamonadaceae bacterium]